MQRRARIPPAGVRDNRGRIALCWRARPLVCCQLSLQVLARLVAAFFSRNSARSIELRPRHIPRNHIDDLGDARRARGRSLRGRHAVEEALPHSRAVAGPVLPGRRVAIDRFLQLAGGIVSDAASSSAFHVPDFFASVTSAIPAAVIRPAAMSRSTRALLAPTICSWADAA